MYVYTIYITLLKCLRYIHATDVYTKLKKQDFKAECPILVLTCRCVLFSILPF